jgi:hypothetical protein
MALILLNPGTSPLGQFDGLDSQYLSMKGGEIATWTGVTYGGSDVAAADVQDGYTGTSSKTRPAVTTTLTSSSAPLFLTDDGTKGYGTLFGVVVGGVAGQTAYGPNSTVPAAAQLGPHTASGSGKVTLWDKPGLYGVTLDAVDTLTGGVIPSNASLTVGKALTFTTAGLITMDGSAQDAGGRLIGNFCEFSTNGSLVNTPQNLVAALNSPSGSVSSLQPLSFYMAIFWYAGAQGV